MHQLLLLPAYMAPVNDYANMIFANGTMIEQHAHYEKKTYRNRAVILGANGTVTLTVPVVKPTKIKTADKDVLISYDTPWQINHWKTIVSAYKSSPFFDYYCDDIEPFYKKRFSFLVDFNTTIMQTICEGANLDVNFKLTDSYISDASDFWDLKDTIYPIKGNPQTSQLPKPVPYRQVFAERHSFVPNLSIIDLLFCKGPETASVLQNMCNGILK